MSFRLINSGELTSISKGDESLTDLFPVIEDVIIPAVTDAFAYYCNRQSFDKTGRIEYFSPRKNVSAIFLNSPPVDTSNPRAITGAVNNGSGGIRITATSHGFNTGLIVTITGVGGVTNANGSFSITVIDKNTFDLVGSTFAGTYTSGGTADLKIQVWESSDTPRVFGSGNLLTLDTDYILWESNGVVERIGSFLTGIKTVKVQYNGGYLTADGDGCPADLKLAAIMQSKILFDRREELSLSSRSLEGGSVSLLIPLMLPKSVTMILDRYREFREQ